MLKKSSVQDLLTPAKDSRIDTLFLRDSYMKKNPNRSLVEQSWEKVNHDWNTVRSPAPTASRTTLRKSFLPSSVNDIEKSIEVESVQGLKKANEALRQQSYQSLVDALKVNNETLISSQRNEIFRLKLTIEDQDKKIQKLELSNSQFQYSYNDKCRELEKLQQHMIQLNTQNQQFQQLCNQKDDKIQALSEQMGVFKTNETHGSSALQEKDDKIQELLQEIHNLQIQNEINCKEKNQLLIDEVNSWKKKFVDLNRDYNIIQEKYQISNAELESACKTRDSIISKTNEIRNNNIRRRTMMVKPFSEKEIQSQIND